MRVRYALPALFLLAAACPLVGSGADVRTVLIDYSHDEFATSQLEYFPRNVKIHPGGTVEFRQTWTGEPHSVTMGTIVDNLFEFAQPLVEKFRAGEMGEPSEEDDAEIEKRMEDLPWMFDEREDGSFYAAQNASQPCYLDEGTVPEDPDTPCDPEDQEKPAFNGRQSYYNSGFIPYEGPEGNFFSVPLAEDIDPGTYFYYCNLHGPLMSGSLEVVPEDQDIPTQEEVNREALAQIEEVTAPLEQVWSDARAGAFEVPEEARGFFGEMGLLRDQRYLDGNIAGLLEPEGSVHGFLLEFLPNDITAEAGEEITWVILGPHTVTFEVPKYFPIVSVEDGEVEINPKLQPPAGGSPPLPSGDQEGPPVIDGGTWDGEGFFSSGLIDAFPFGIYTLRITQPGTYPYACLLHPEMVGEVEIT